MFGKDVEEIGSSNKNLVLKSSGKIKLQWGKKFIDLLDSNGNINVKALNIIKSINSSEEITKDGFYILKDSLIAKNGENILEISSSTSSNFVSFTLSQELTNEQKEQVQLNIGLIYQTKPDDYPENGLIYVLDELKLYSIKDGVLNEFINKSETNSDTFESDSEFKFSINGSEVLDIDSNGIENEYFSIKNISGYSTLTVDKINSEDFNNLFDYILELHKNDTVTVQNTITYSNISVTDDFYDIEEQIPRVSIKLNVVCNTIWNASCDLAVNITNSGYGNSELELIAEESQSEFYVIVKDMFYNRLIEKYSENDSDIISKHKRVIHIIKNDDNNGYLIPSEN